MTEGQRVKRQFWKRHVGVANYNTFVALPQTV